MSKVDKAIKDKEKARPISSKYIIYSVLALIFVMLIATLFTGKTELGENIAPKTPEDNIADKESEEMLWRKSIEQKLSQKSSDVSKKVEEVRNENKGQKLELDSRIEGIEKKIDIPKDNYLTKEIEKLYAELRRMKREVDEMKIEKDSNLEEAPIRSKMIAKHSTNLIKDKNSKSYKPIKTTGNYIPAGSWVKAVLMTGVAASTSLEAPSDPKPVILKITNMGTLPNSFKNDIKNCHVVGAAYGELESERVQVRLEKLSCIDRNTEEVIETDVGGTVTGTDSVIGTKGKIVQSQTKVLERSMLAEFIQGMGNIADSRNGNSGLVISKDGTKLTQRAKDSLASGLTSATDRVSKYYLDILNRSQPIIYVNGGVDVTLLFVKGSYFGESETVSHKSRLKDRDILKQFNEELK